MVADIFGWKLFRVCLVVLDENFLFPFVAGGFQDVRWKWSRNKCVRAFPFPFFPGGFPFSLKPPPPPPQTSYPASAGFIGIIYIYILVSEVGGVSPTRKSFRFIRACVRARGLVVRWKRRANERNPLSLFLLLPPRFPLFPFRRTMLSLFPCGICK